MSLAGTMRYFIGLATDQLLPHQCLLCGKFCFDRGVCADITKLARWLAPPDTFAPNILRRRHYNKSQAGLSRAQRKKNVAGIFSVPQKYRATLAGRPVILVDDVMASGATLSAAARCLAGSRKRPGQESCGGACFVAA